MTDQAIDGSGRLRERLRPAVYFDASVLIDYWVTEGMETDRQFVWEPRDMPHQLLLRELLRADKRVAGMVEIRKTLLFEKLDAFAVTSPVALLEVIEWYAQSAIKNLSADAAGAQAVQRMGQKDVGRLLKRILDDRAREADQSPGAKRKSTPLDMLTFETFIGPGFASAHGLAGVVTADVRDFAFTEDDVWGVSEVLAYLQMGMADIVHLLLARHLGCTWIASFDSDFLRCREHILDGLGLNVLATSEEILSVLTRGECA